VNLLLIAIGARSVGARYLFSMFVLRVTGSLLPIGTFAVNVLGCVIFGGIAGARRSSDSSSRPKRGLSCSSAFSAGFTTFSSYAYESFLLTRDGQFAALNALPCREVWPTRGLWAA